MHLSIEPRGCLKTSVQFCRHNITMQSTDRLWGAHLGREVSFVLLPSWLLAQQHVFYGLRYSVNMWNSFKYYHPLTTSLHSCGGSYYNHMRLVEVNVEKSSPTFRGWKWIEIHLILWIKMYQPLGAFDFNSDQLDFLLYRCVLFSDRRTKKIKRLYGWLAIPLLFFFFNLEV